ncbi:MAG: sulfatase-like hydrolase/transferase [Planctomycetota bacterium]|nr:sulfatase-like hydrolase/transferase [Planctomycetota bacterium]
MHLDPLRSAARRHASLTLWVANVAAGTLVGTAYLEHVPADASLATWIFGALGLLSSVATLALVPALLLWAIHRWVRSDRLTALAAGLVGGVFLVLLAADTVVFTLLGHHFNGAVWNVVFTRGSEDAVHLGAGVWVPSVGALALLTLIEAWLWSVLLRRRLVRRANSAPRAFSLRPIALLGGAYLAIFAVEKTIYAAAEYRGDRQVHGVSQALPMYQGLRVSALLPEELAGAERLPTVEFRLGDRALVYPQEMPQVDPAGPRPNILLLVIDTWRRDMLDESTTPELWAFAQGARRFEDHWSGGNSTRFGIFSLLYGLHGSYWFPVFEARRPPVLMDVLGELGYERAVFSSASQSYPEFRETAWAELIPELILDDHDGERADERDGQVAQRFDEWMACREASERPFFAFVLLDSPHQPYDSPFSGPFQPAAEALNYIELARSNAPDLVQRVFNRYRNAVHHADTVAGDILNALREHGALENTLVVITGDHGEEFQENGFWGHTSNFSSEQLAVPMLLSGPRVEPGVERRATTHADLPATLLELLGADPSARARWTQGANLLSPPAGRALTVAGWEHLGLILGDEVFRVGVEARSPLDVEVFDLSWKPVADPGGAYLREYNRIETLARECTQFLASEPTRWWTAAAR